MSQLKLSSVKVSAYVHGTEDVEKVRNSFASLLEMDKAAISRYLQKTIVEGDFNNNIIIFQVRLTKRKLILQFLKNLSKRLSSDQKKTIRLYFDRFFNVDAKTLFLRFHKQLLTDQQLVISQADDIIHVAIKFSVYTKIEIADSVQMFLIEKNVLA